MGKAPGKNEAPVVAHYGRNGKLLFITMKGLTSGLFYLYEVIEENGEEKLSLLGKDKSPAVLEKKFKVAERMRGETI